MTGTDCVEPLLSTLRLPERFKYSEIIGGLLVAYSGRAVHGGTVHALWAQLDARLPAGLAWWSGGGVAFEAGANEFCPDLMLVPAVHAAHGTEWCDPEQVMLVIEVIAPETRVFEYGIKAAVYARAGIAEYVVFDPYARSATRYAEPENSEYTLRQVIHYGKPVRIEQPFPLLIETAGLPVDPQR